MQAHTAAVTAFEAQARAQALERIASNRWCHRWPYQLLCLESTQLTRCIHAADMPAMQGMELKAKGFKARYLNEYLVKGEAPTDPRGVFKQRSRWCKGQIQVRGIDQQTLLTPPTHIRTRSCENISSTLWTASAALGNRPSWPGQHTLSVYQWAFLSARPPWRSALRLSNATHRGCPVLHMYQRWPKQPPKHSTVPCFAVKCHVSLCRVIVWCNVVCCGLL